MIKQREVSGKDKEWYEQVYSERSEAIHTYKLKMLEFAVSQIDSGLILDIGCGTGQMSRLLTEQTSAKVIGVDLAYSGLQKAREIVDVAQVDLSHSLPFPSNTFDAVWFTEVIEHVVSPADVLQEINRILRPGGFLFLTTPNSAFHFFRYFSLLGKVVSELQHPGHLQFFSKKSLEADVKQAGFDIDNSLGRAVYMIIPMSWRKDIIHNFPTRREGIIIEDTLTRGPLLMWTKFTKLQASFWADTLMIVAAKK